MTIVIIYIYSIIIWASVQREKTSIGKKLDLRILKVEKGDTSHYYKYLVNEKDRTFELVSEFDVPYSGYVSSVQEIGKTIVVDSGMACTFENTLRTGN